MGGRCNLGFIFGIGLIIGLLFAGTVQADEVVIEESFDNNQSQYFSESETEGATTKIVDERLVMTVEDDLLMVFQTPNDPQKRLKSFTAEVDCQRLDGPTNNGFGLIVNVSDNEFWHAGISSDGYYQIRKFAGNEWALLRRWSKSKKIDDRRHRLKLVVEPPKARLFIDGQLLTEVSDPIIKGGYVGLYVQSVKKGGVKIAFDDFVVKGER